MSIGNRVFLQRNLPPKELVDAYRELPAANVADSMGRLCALSPQIKRLSRAGGKIMCGVALTVKSRGGDNLMLHEAMNISQPGDVIVYSGDCGRERAIMGEIMYRYLEGFKKIEGVVIDGPIRDIDAISEGELPIYATGTTPGGPYKDGTGEVNVPISCGGITVNPGDIILGDMDGVIVIPRQDAAEILEKAQKLAANDHMKAENSAKGTVNRQWVDDLLEAKKVEIIDGSYSA